MSIGFFLRASGSFMRKSIVGSIFPPLLFISINIVGSISLFPESIIIVIGSMSLPPRSDIMSIGLSFTESSPPFIIRRGSMLLVSPPLLFISINIVGSIDLFPLSIIIVIGSIFPSLLFISISIVGSIFPSLLFISMNIIGSISLPLPSIIIVIGSMSLPPISISIVGSIFPLLPDIRAAVLKALIAFSFPLFSIAVSIP